jgi:hypothetical protein
MIFSIDSDIYRLRANLDKYLPAGTFNWDSYHERAGRRIIQELGLVITGFNWKNLYAGWHFWSYQTARVSAEQRVFVADTHNAGGVPGHIYQAQADQPEQDLPEVDFTSGAWADVTGNLSDSLNDLSCYHVLWEIYQFLANDLAENDAFISQRDYFKVGFDDELVRICNNSDILPYNWDDDELTGDIELQVFAI